MIWRPSAIFELYRVADYFLMKDLCDAIIKFISSTFCEYNFGQVYEWALEIGNVELEKTVFKKWNENGEKFGATDQIQKLIERNESPDFFMKLLMKMHGVKEQGDDSLDKIALIKSIVMK